MPSNWSHHVITRMQVGDSNVHCTMKQVIFPGSRSVVFVTLFHTSLTQDPWSDWSSFAGVCGRLLPSLIWTFLLPCWSNCSVWSLELQVPAGRIVLSSKSWATLRLFVSFIFLIPPLVKLQLTPLSGKESRPAEIYWMRSTGRGRFELATFIVKRRDVDHLITDDHHVAFVHRENL